MESADKCILDPWIPGHMKNLISMRRGRFFKMLFVRPSLKYGECSSILLFAYWRGNQNPCLWVYCITNERGIIPGLGQWVWVESLGTNFFENKVVSTTKNGLRIGQQLEPQEITFLDCGELNSWWLFRLSDCLKWSAIQVALVVQTCPEYTCWNRYKSLVYSGTTTICPVNPQFFKSRSLSHCYRSQVWRRTWEWYNWIQHDCSTGPFAREDQSFGLSVLNSCQLLKPSCYDLGIVNVTLRILSIGGWNGLSRTRVSMMAFRSPEATDLSMGSCWILNLREA